MGCDTKLLVNSKYRPREIQALIELLVGDKVEYQPSNVGPEFFWFAFKFNGRDRRMAVFLDNHTPLGIATELSLGMDNDSQKLFEEIADRIGGIYTANDCGSKGAEIISGATDEDNGLPYFVRYGIIRGMNFKSVPALKKCIRDWQASMTHMKTTNDMIVED